MNHKGLGIILILSLLLGVVVSTTAAQNVEPAAEAPDGQEIEPNDDFDMATYMKWRENPNSEAFRSGVIDRPADVDYYTFNITALDGLAIDWKQWGSPIRGKLSLYDQDRVLLAEAVCAGSGVCLQYSAEQGQSLYLRVSNADGTGGPDYSYQFTLTYTGKVDPNEPNDTAAAATPIALDETKLGALYPCGEEDFFTFDGTAETVLEVYINGGDRWQLLDAGGKVIAESTEDYLSRYVVLPATAAYTLRLFGTDWCSETYELSLLRHDPEPNNTMATAIPIAYGDDGGGLGWPCGDVDYYRFTGRAGDDVRFYSWGTSEILTAAGEVISDNPYGDAMATLPADGTYYARRTQSADSCEYPTYWWNLTLLGNSEPNDSIGQAKPIAYGQASGGLISCDELDYFSFRGQAGDEISIRVGWYTFDMDLLDPNQQLLAHLNAWTDRLHMFLPATGTYYLKLSRDEYCDQGRQPYSFSIDRVTRPLYVSFNKGGVLQGVRFTAGDVLHYWPDTGELEMYLDMSDLGLTGNLTAFDKAYWSDVILGFSSRYSVRGLGPVQPQDLVATYLNTSGPDTTADPIQMYFKGANAGLTTSGERIGAVARTSRTWGNYLLMTTTGRAKVPADGTYTLENEDFTWFIPSDMGFYTAGSWLPYIDGSFYGLDSAAIVAADADSFDDMNGDALWLVFDRPVVFAGVRFDPGDIANCFEVYGEDTLCNSVTKYFDASEAGFGSYRIDALEVGDETR